MDTAELHNQKEVIAMELYQKIMVHHIKTGESIYNANRLSTRALDEFNKTFEYIDSTDGD